MSPFERTLRGPSGRVYTGTSCGLLIWMPPRRHCILMVENKSFDNFILLVILMNCITMAWESPLEAMDWILEASAVRAPPSWDVDEGPAVDATGKPWSRW